MPPGRITMLFGDEWYDKVRERLAYLGYPTRDDKEIHAALQAYTQSIGFIDDLIVDVWQ